MEGRSGVNLAVLTCILRTTTKNVNFFKGKKCTSAEKVLAVPMLRTG